jgi:hypothetical protein
LLFIVFVFALAPAAAQPLAKQSDQGTYAIPFASEGNRIELEVVNSAATPLKDVIVDVEAIPTWLTFETTSQAMGTLASGESSVAVFKFDQDERAPVGQVTSIDFDVRSATGFIETRTIDIQAEAPTELMLRGNYPNPFNPATKIAYALPTDANVQIEIFNAIGQRVTRLVDGLREAGYRETAWNATSFPSGVYFYSIVFDAERERSVKFGKMLLVR